MRAGGIKRLLDKVGFGWVIAPSEKLETISISDVTPIPLWGNFDLGFA
jgi:hypothetical protein